MSVPEELTSVNVSTNDAGPATDPTTPGPWDCACGPQHNSAIVAECPFCHTRRPFDYEAPTPTLPSLDERFDMLLAKQRAGQGLTVPQSGRGPGYHVPVKLRQGESSIDVDSILIQSIIDVGNKAAHLGAIVEIQCQMVSSTQGRLTLQVDYDFANQPLPHTIEERP